MLFKNKFSQERLEVRVLTSNSFIYFLGYGFMFTAVLGIAFEIHQALIFGFSLFAFIITISEFFADPIDNEQGVIDKKSLKVFGVFRGMLVASSIPISIGLPLVANELFTVPDEVFSRFSSYITISSIGMILIMRKKR